MLTTIAAEADGAALGRALVDARLAACVNVLPAMTWSIGGRGRSSRIASSS